MKTLFTCFCLLAIGLLSAQNGINYKAVIKDDLGHVIANSSVDIKFQILESDALVNVYEETHSPMTDNNGIIIVNIGEGTVVSGLFDAINWGEDNHYLNVKIDIGSGFIDMGTTQFSAVPYAFHAKKAANVKGLEAIDEGNGIGWRLVDRNPDNYENIGFNAIDFSFVDDPTLGLGAIGSYSFSLGHNGTASGEHALAFGNQNYSLNDYAIALGNNNVVSGLNSTAIGGINQVNGDYAFATGLQNIASENYTIAMGNQTTASGEHAVAIGNNTTASGESSVALGRNTEASGNYSTSFGRFTIASGNWAVALGASSIASENHSTAIGVHTEASGIVSTAMGRYTNATGFASTSMGASSTASGDYSTAMGFETEASGTYSIAVGNNSEAIGSSSVAMGSTTQALGNFSTAMGHVTEASGQTSTTMGSYTEASGVYSTAMGSRTTALAYNSTVLGRYNLGGGNPTAWFESDPLFEIGNGQSDANRSNALTIYKDGRTRLNSSSSGLEVNSEGYIGIGIAGGNNFGLFVYGGTNIGIRVFAANQYGGSFTGNDAGIYADTAINANPDIILGGDSGNANDDGIIASDPNYAGSDIYLRSNDAVVIELDHDDNGAGNFFIRDSDGDNAFSVNEAGTIRQNGATIHSSDRRLKKDIENLEYGLKEVLQLAPKAYHWKNKNQAQKSLGLIAQDVQLIIKEIVTAQDNTDKILGISYTELIPVLINAIKEQQKIIDDEKSINAKQSSQLEALLSRIESLEANQSN